MKRRPLVAFFILSFILSWAIWGMMPYIKTPSLWDKAMVWGGYGPFFAALIVTGFGGMEGLRGLLSRLVQARVGWRWYLVALFLPTVLVLMITLIHLMFGGAAPDYSKPLIYFIPLSGFWAEYHAATILVPFFIITLLTGSSIAEEIGWRGFVLPYLQHRWSALVASLILGLSWSVWFLPALIFSGGSTEDFLIKVSGVIPAAIIATWLFNNTKGSLIPVILFNNSVKVTELFIATPLNIHPLIPVATFWIVALILLLNFGGTRLCRTELDQRCRNSDLPTAVPVLLRSSGESQRSG